MNVINLSESEILKRLDDAGVVITEMKRDFAVRSVLKYWPILAETHSQHIPPLGSDEYYENVYAAAKTGDESFTLMFINNCQLSRAQGDEIRRVLRAAQ